MAVKGFSTLKTVAALAIFHGFDVTADAGAECIARPQKDMKMKYPKSVANCAECNDSPEGGCKTCKGGFDLVVSTSVEECIDEDRCKTFWGGSWEEGKCTKCENKYDSKRLITGCATCNSNGIGCKACSGAEDNVRGHYDDGKTEHCALKTFCYYIGNWIAEGTNNSKTTICKPNTMYTSTKTKKDVKDGKNDDKKCEMPGCEQCSSDRKTCNACKGDLTKIMNDTKIVGCADEARCKDYWGGNWATNKATKKECIPCKFQGKPIAGCNKCHEKGEKGCASCADGHDFVANTTGTDKTKHTQLCVKAGGLSTGAIVGIAAGSVSAVGAGLFFTKETWMGWIQGTSEKGVAIFIGIAMVCCLVYVAYRSRVQNRKANTLITAELANQASMP